MTTTRSSTNYTRLAIVQALADVTAWAINATTWATGRAVSVHTLSIDECEALGMPEGTTEPHVYVQELGGAARWWHLDAWNENDGGGCFHMRALGMSVEIHHEEASAGNPAGA